MRNYEKEKKETKSKILHAFWEIYRTTRIEKITVKQITEACGIYRTTFYLHYVDVYAILENLEQDLLGEIHAFKDAMSLKADGVKATLYNLYELCKKHQKYTSVLVVKQNSSFAVRYRQEIVSILCQIYSIPAKKMQGFLEQSLMTHWAELFLCWVENTELKFDDVYQFLERCLKKGTLSAILQK